MSELAVRTPHRLNPDPRRVIARLFVPGEETPEGRSRAKAVIARVLALTEAEVASSSEAIITSFRCRHRDLTGTFARHFAVVAHEIPGHRSLSSQRRMLIGACFTMEYSPEGAALFNPSMVAHPDQSGLAPGQLRFLMTVRSVGEGHLSSIGFRTGELGADGALTVTDPEPLLTTANPRSTTYQRRVFLSRLADLGADHEHGQLLLGRLPEVFTADELADALAAIHEHTLNRDRFQRMVEHVRQISASTYDVEFAPNTALTERLLWPTAPSESHGMEDARLVRFVDDDATVTYYATYTAYDGARVEPHLVATQNFRRFHVSPMAGRAARNKGLALFPRRIGGRLHALSRWDRENLALVSSDDCRVWDEPTTLYTPIHQWEQIQVGNCGSPIETPDGWLVITHGVGPMRQYALGAMLLDRADPSIVRATLSTPLLVPNAAERDGYVPNVVYSCGPMLHEEIVTIPYGISDGAIGFAQVALPELLSRMDHRPRR